MPSKYSIIQFSPNAVSGERINIGVIVFDDQTTRVNFISNWARVKSFARADVTFLRDLAEEFALLSSDQLTLPGTGMGPKLNEDLIQEMTSNWANSIQLTEPRASLKPIGDLLASISRQFLTEPSRHERAYRDRRSAASVARITLYKALENLAGKEEADKYVQSQSEVKGKYGPHVFDVVVANGTPKIALQGVSFELPEAAQLDQLVDAVAFQVFDVRQVNKKVHVGILALPPTPQSHPRARKIYKRAKLTYEGLDAQVIEERDAEKWARDHVEAYAA